MARTNSAVAESAERELVITRIFDAPRSLVFKAWIEPERLAHWWGPRSFTLLSCEMDPRPGGTYRFHMRGPDGDDHWPQGVVREIAEPDRLIVSWCWADAAGNPKSPETVLTVTFEEQGAKTKLTLRQAVFESATARDQHRGGWTSAFDRLAEYVVTARN